MDISRYEKVVEHSKSSEDCEDVSRRILMPIGGQKHYTVNNKKVFSVIVYFIIKINISILN